MWHLAICSPVSVPYQGGGTPLCSDLDQGAGEEAKARQVEPGGMEELRSEGSIFAAGKLEFKHLFDDWREGFYWQEAFDFSLSSG